MITINLAESDSKGTRVFVDKGEKVSMYDDSMLCSFVVLDFMRKEKNGFY
jgi:hypothetical protein